MARKTQISPRDEAILRLATQEGVTKQGDIVQRLVALGYGKVTPSRIGQVLRTNTGQYRVMTYLARHPGQEFTATEIAIALNLDINHVSYAVDAMMKKGITEFKITNGTNGHRTLEHIRLTKRIVARMEKVEAAPETGPEPKPEPEPEPEAKAEPEVEPEKADEPEVVPEPEHVVALASEALADVIERAKEMTPNDGLGGIPIHDIPRFPMINRLLTRDRDITEAVKLLERQGLDEIALSALSQMDRYSKLEREVITFVRVYGPKE